MAMVTTLFFMWGFLTSLNDVLIPHLKSIFALSYVQASLIQVAFFGSYFVFALPAGKLVEWVGYKRTMVIGLLTMGFGAILFVPAAAAPSYNLFLTALIVLAAGITVLQVAANPYVTSLGPQQTASSRLNLTQAFNSLGTTIAPILGGIFILGGATGTVKNIQTLHGAALDAYRVQQASSVRMPYVAIAIALVVLAMAIALYRFPRLEFTRDFRPAGQGAKPDSIWNYPHLYLGAIAIFIYVGAEVSIGSYLINYFGDPQIGGLDPVRAAKLVGFYWGGAMVGRFIGAALLQKVQANKLLALCGLGAGVLVFASFLGTGYFAIVTILLVGLFNSVMFPSIFALALAELGPLTGRGSGLLVQAVVGGAVIPYFMAKLADSYGIHHSLLLPLICYLYIVYYGLSGYRVGPAPVRKIATA